MTQKKEAQQYPDYDTALSEVIQDLSWFWTNSLVRKYLLIANFSREHVRTIDTLVTAATESGSESLSLASVGESVADVVSSSLELAECVKNEVKPMLELEKHRAGPEMDATKRVQLDMTLSNLEPNRDALVNHVQKLRAVAKQQ